MPWCATWCAGASTATSTLHEAQPRMTKPGRILLVEDNQDNRIIYRSILAFAGHDVMEAADGESGVEIARSELPDVILMDISLPVLDGWEATQILKSDPGTKHIPIIA